MLISNDAAPQRYEVAGNSTIAYDKPVVFPVNGVLARTMKKGEDVKVVLFATENDAKDQAKYRVKFKEELNRINMDIGAHITYDESIEMPFMATEKIFDTTLRALIGKMEEEAEIIADITYGAKPQPILLFCALNFAEKFFNADIKNIVYGKVDFVQDPNNPDPKAKKIPANPVLYDITSLYYLNSLTNVMECRTSGEALKMLDGFFPV
jgi:hypothetical protein